MLAIRCRVDRAGRGGDAHLPATIRIEPQLGGAVMNPTTKAALQALAIGAVCGVGIHLLFEVIG